MQGHIFVVEAIQQILRGIERDDLSLFQHRHASAQLFGFFKIMGGQQNRVALPVQAADELPQRLTQLHVHARRRLVEHDDWRFMH